MKLLADECVFRNTAEALRQAGHEVVTAQEMSLAGKDDKTVLDAATQAGYIFVTNDMHFSNILVYPPVKFAGIIVLRIRPQTQDRIHASLLAFLERSVQEDLGGMLVIIDPNKYRVRRGR